MSRYNALAEAKAHIKFELAPIPGTAPLTMNLMMLFEVSLMRVAQTACDFFRKHDDAEEAAVMGEFRSALLTREAEPVEITLTVDGGAATPVLDAEAALLAELPERPPREVTVRVTQPRAEALAAPRGGLVSSNRTNCRLFPLDARPRDARGGIPDDVVPR